MNKIAKAILVALGVILVIGVVAVLGVNLYVQSAETRARIERGLSAGLHTPVKVGSLSFMPWYGLKLSGISRENTGEPQEGNSVEISDIKLHFQLSKLLRRDLVIKELTIDGVKVSWTQNPEGKWQMPPNGASASQMVESPAQNETAVEPPVAGRPPPPAPKPYAPPAAAPESRPVIVKHARLRDSSFTFYDKSHRPFAALTGVYVQTPFPTDKLVEGTAAVSQVVVQKEFYISNWHGNFKRTPGELSLFDTHCEVGGGPATGTLDVKIAEPDSPFALDINFSRVNLDRLLTDAGVSQLQATGMISGFLHLEGDSRDRTAARGKGEIALADGFIKQSALFDSVGGLLGTNKFRGLAVEDAHANFHIGGGNVFLDDLTLKSASLTFAGKGAIPLDGSGLHLLCRLAISADVARQIPEYLLQNFAKDKASGERYVDFPITDIKHPDSGFKETAGKHMSLKSGWKSILGIQPAAAPDP